jgi:predicted N-acetyltransferase YhbS
MQDIRIRLMVADDLSGADHLRRLAGWNQRLSDWVRLLKFAPAGCFVAIRDGIVVGTVTTTAYGKTLAWIGMMLVHPEHRRHGIGTRLMHQALQCLRDQNVGCIKLDATPAGFPLYQQLGFVSEWTLTRFQRLAGSERMPGHPGTKNTRVLKEADWRAVEEIDTRAFGISRVDLLRDLAKDSRRALVYPADGPVLGWGMLRPGTNADYLGPVTCSCDEGPISLIAALLGAGGDRSVYWDVPDQSAAAQAIARQCGFTPVRPLTRMRLGSEIPVLQPRAQLAIADPAIG